METSIMAEVEINYKPKKFTSKIKISSSRDAFEQFERVWSGRINYVEEMYVLLLNNANQVLGYHYLGKGGTVGVVADKKVILALALNTNSHSLILAHNHPSGNLKASRQDIELTTKLKAAAKLMDIEVHDHLILSGEGTYLSMADDGLM